MKKYRKKRIVSCLLAAVTAFSPCLQPYPAYGADTAEVSSKTAPGQVDVSILSALVLKKDVGFTVSLSPDTEQAKEYTEKLTLAKDQGEDYPTKAETSFADLAQGTYTLTVAASGFADYRQKITVSDKAYHLTLMTGFAAGYSYDGAVHPGVILIGDLNGDGIIDELDKKQMTDAVDAGSGEHAVYDASADLNGDGRTDLADLEYFAKSYKEAAAVTSTVETGIPAAKLDVKEGRGTQIAGDSIRSLLKSGESVWLSRSDGEDISKEHPVSIDFAFQEGCGETGGIVIESGADNPVQTAEVDIYDDSGVPSTVAVGDSARTLNRYQADAARVTKTGDGTIVIDLKSQVPVKRVTIRVTSLRGSQKLAEISKVTFLGDMGERIPKPETSVPANLKAEAGSTSFTASWSPCENVTGYEVLVSKQPDADSQDKLEEVIQVKGSRLAVSTLLNSKLENYKKYYVSVRSVNGTWRSAYTDPVEVEPRPTAKPDAPDNVSAAGRYRAVRVSWKKVKEAVTYKLYYKKASDSDYSVIEGIEETDYTLSGLEEKTRYLFYVTGVNELGEGRPSLTVSAETKDLELAKVPRYKMINAAASGRISPYITNASAASGSMHDSPEDAGAKTAWGSVDSDPKTYYMLNSWDDGGFNTLGGHGLVYEFDRPYQMKMIALQEFTEQDLSYGYAQIRYWGADGQPHELDKGQITVQKKTDADGRGYYMLRLSSAVTAKKIQIGLARALASGTVTVSEMYFYHYDSLEDEIMALYTDDLHMVLRSDVSQAVIDALRMRINTKDTASGEYHPDKEMLERELKTAEDILHAGASEPVRIHSTITTAEKNKGFGGLNAWQPLGVTAAAGEELTVYAGHNTKRTGESTNLQLVATQYHAESSPMFQVVGTLKIGRNDITVPKIGATDTERGGALYVQYTGNNPQDAYAVRVSGGTEVPVLDLYKVTDVSQRTERITEYVTKLEAYVSGMQEKHKELHVNAQNKNVRYPYDSKNCILGATDILLDTMMLSLPAAQVLSGAGENNAQRTETISESMYAMEDMMKLFYQHKGLNSSAPDEIDRIPCRHLNIRYQRMFAGAFMYASGNHIGIEYPQAAGMVSGRRVQTDENGRHTAGKYFGWGIAHEIGHCINQGAYAVAEITNNYFSVLAQADETNRSVRFSYDEVFKKVTSNALGRANNVFTQLGMYWQLHLAYDKGYNYKTYDEYNEQLANLFFARVDTYARTPGKAPAAAENGKPLQLSSDADQNLMRLSCAAAQKNLLEFFMRWGMVPDAETRNYAGQFKEETRAVCYANDEARIYQLAGGSSVLIQPDGSTGMTEAVADSVSCSVNKDAGSQVDFVLDAKNVPAQDVLGYEIVRCTGYGDAQQREYAGFAKAEAGKAVFSDHITTMNNRVITYEVTLIDKYLGRSKPKKLAPVKIQHMGDIDKTGWTVSADGITATNVERPEGTEESENMCGVEQSYLQAALQKAVDSDNTTAFSGIAQENAQLITEFGRTHAVTGCRYTIPEGTQALSYKIFVRTGNGEWKEAAAGRFENAGPHEVWFADETANGKYPMANKNIAAYQADAVKLVLLGQSGAKIAVSEIDVFGWAGDNIAFRETVSDGNGSTQPAVGKLKTAFSYGEGENAVTISPGSIVFTGSYKGNAAYNVVKLCGQNGNLIAGRKGDAYTADQLICADVPKDGLIQNVSAGTWIYWIDADAVLDLDGITEIHAELYRVDNANTNEGERLVSDTLPLPVSVLSNLTEIEIVMQPSA